MRSQDRVTEKVLILTLGIVFLLGAPAHAAELKPKTLQAFNHYVELTEVRMAKELREDQPFLSADGMPERRRQAVYDQLRRGDVIVEHAETREQGKPIKIPDGLVHHWVGMIFVPGATLQQTLAVLQDYDHHQDYFKPSVRRSRLLERDGNDYKVFLQLYRKTIVTAVFNADFDVHYVLVDDKPRILAAVKDAWGSRVTTVFPRQGQYAHDAKALASFAMPDVTVDRIGDLLDCDLGRLLAAVPRLEAVRR